jgi:hypothetical protein
VGDFCDEICINTEYHHFVLTVSAKVGAALQEEPQPELPVPIMSPVQVHNDENAVENSSPVVPPTKPELALQPDIGTPACAVSCVTCFDLRLACSDCLALSVLLQKRWNSTRTPHWSKSVSACNQLAVRKSCC